jgi:hypothetical protein
MGFTPRGFVSTANSTSTNLGANAIFTGTSEDVSQFSSIAISVFSSHASATDGLSLQQSSDGSNWDIIDTYTISAAAGKTISIQVTAKFFRLVYTNGGTLTTSLRIQSIYHTSAKKGSSVRPQDARSNENDMEEVIAYNAIYNGTTWDRTRGDTTNGMDVDVTRMKPDGTNTMPSMDVASRASFNKITDGTLTIGAVDETGASAVDALAIGGGTPHDSVDSGNPVKIGYKASNALPTAVANADRVNGISDLWGRQMVTHIDPAQQVFKSFNATTTQTGTDVWSPTSGKKIAITSIVIGTYGTTAGRIILWFGDNADTTYTAGTDQLVLAFSTAPSTTSKPGLVFTPAYPIFCTTADRELHITTDAAVSIDIAVYGYEW